MRAVIEVMVRVSCWQIGKTLVASKSLGHVIVVTP